MRVSALMAPTPAGGRAVTCLGLHRALEVLREDRRENGEAFAGELVVRLPRRFCRAHRWPDALGPGRASVLERDETLHAVCRVLREGVRLAPYLPASIGLPRRAA